MRATLDVPPVASPKRHVSTVQGQELSDDYYWLRHRDDPEVRQYIEAENAWTGQRTAAYKDLEQELFNEMKGRIKADDNSVPYRKGPYRYYRRFEASGQYPIFCRKGLEEDSTEEVLLNVNELAREHSYCSLGVYRVSPDHSKLLFSLDTNGSEQYTLYIKDLDTGTVQESGIRNSSTAAEWANDNKTIFYTALDETHRPWRVCRYVPEGDSGSSEVVLQEDDEAFFVTIERSRSDAMLIVLTHSKTSSENYIIDADRPREPLRLVEARRPDVLYYLEHHRDSFFVMTNESATNFMIMQAPEAGPGREHWREYIAHRADVTLEEFWAFRDYLVVLERAEGQQRLRVDDLGAGVSHIVALPEPVYTVASSANPEFNSAVFRFSYTSLVTPQTVYDYHMERRELELKKQREIPGGYQPELYCTERVFAEAEDGALVPVSLVYRRGLKLDGNNPTYLFGYGAYGFAVNPAFSTSRLSLLERGFVFAIAHVRGGGAMGRSWYEAGKLEHKKNTFSDFIACAETLIKRGYTRPQKLVAVGGSAGGLLIGAVANMRPDLFRILVALVPFVDVLNTMLDESLPLTVTEYEEWGNPNDKRFFDLIRSYSPYDNVCARDYPDILILAGLNDPRVQYWEPLKWLAKLRATKTDRNEALLKMNMESGHSGATGRYAQLKDVAFEYAFIINRLREDAEAV